MIETKLSNEAREILDNFLKTFPVVSQSSYRKRLMNGLEYHVLKTNCCEVSKQDLLEVLEETLPKSFEPLTLKFKNPERLSAIAKAQKDIDRENPAVKVMRWQIPNIHASSPVGDVFAIMASPRKNGSTDCIMNTLLEGAKESGCNVEKVYITDINISPCTGCMSCEHKELESFCAIKDDMTQLYQRFLECDAFVMGFPVYTARECSQAAIFFDRLKALRTPGQFKKLSKKRSGALVVTWGWPSKYAYNHVVENAAFVLKLFGVETAEVITGSGFWDAYYKKGTALLDTNGLAQAKEAGRALVAG